MYRPQLLLVDYSEQVKMQLTPTSLVDSATALRLDYLRSEAAGTQDWSLNTLSKNSAEFRWK